MPCKDCQTRDSEFTALREGLATIFGDIKPHHGMSWSACMLAKITDQLAKLENDPTDDELNDVVATWDWSHYYYKNVDVEPSVAKQMIRDGICIWHSRRKPKKSIEERITVAPWILDRSKWIVLVDGLVDGWNTGNYIGFSDRRDAERYRRGLIEELKEKEAQESRDVSCR